MSFENYASLKEKLIYPELYSIIQSQNETLGIWDLTTTDAPSIQVNRLFALPTVSAVDCDTVITATDLSGGPVTYNFDTFQETVPLCWKTKVGANGGGTAEAMILSTMLEAAVQKMEALIIDGGTNFNGLQDLVVGSQTFAKAGAAGGIEDLDKAIRITKGGPNKVFVSNGATQGVVLSKMRAASVVNYSQLGDSTFNTLNYRGTPFVVNENLAAGEVFLATLGGNGVSVVFNEDSGRKLGGIFDVINIPMALASINEYYRVLFQATQVLRSTQALSKITGFTA